MKRYVAPILITTVFATGLFGFLMMAHAPHSSLQMGSCVVAALSGGGCAVSGSAKSIDFHVGLLKAFAVSLGATVFAVFAAFIITHFFPVTHAMDTGPPLPQLIGRSKFRQTRWRRRVAEWLSLHELRDA